MSDMIEKVARAIAGHFGPEYDALPVDNMERRQWNRYSGGPHDNSQADVLEAARAAIEAMREPTEAMLLEGGGNCELVWQDMIDTALKDPD